MLIVEWNARVKLYGGRHVYRTQLSVSGELYSKVEKSVEHNTAFVVRKAVHFQVSWNTPKSRVHIATDEDDRHTTPRRLPDRIPWQRCLRRRRCWK